MPELSDNELRRLAADLCSAGKFNKAAEMLEKIESPDANTAQHIRLCKRMADVGEEQCEREFDMGLFK